MSYQRVPYEDAATPAEMQSDCAAVERELLLSHLLPPRQSGRLTRPPLPLPAPAVSDEMADRAAGMELHLA
ncbi:MAG: hypothetical protein AVDCRST_MAG34-1038 [uncultured Nocardioidaceae bacterium]|uniref:Uncharacterized protein n=1 Tax=uncultured Nocardioidaceae bacterium TaxID=253824 RepID=A0A6J4LV88_9ACTN|nr:MAG: hypothetical protein AVDCRST_MAG34-1038 [uncultured Nocardioidaceae bacterium]